MNIIEKVNKTRYTLKEILEDEWDVSSIADLSDNEIQKIYSIPSSKNSNLALFGPASGCNFSLKHRKIPSHKLHIIYFNLPEIGRQNSKVTKAACEKLNNVYQSELINFEDSLFVLINDNISESLEKSFSELNIILQNTLQEKGLNEKIISEMKENNIQLENKHFRNIHLFNVNHLTNNVTKHRFVPKHIPIRDKDEINKILSKCNCTINQCPIILKTDIISKFIRLAPGDLCKITRKSSKCGTYPFYRVCK